MSPDAVEITSSPIKPEPVRRVRSTRDKTRDEKRDEGFVALMEEEKRKASDEESPEPVEKPESEEKEEPARRGKSPNKGKRLDLLV